MQRQSASREAARVSTLAIELHGLIGKLKRRLREEAHLGDFTFSQTAVLRRLDREGPATVTTLAKAEGVRPQSMGATVAVLEAAGLVAGAADPRDGRQTILSLTPACRKMIKEGRATREDWLFRAIQEHLTAEEQTELAIGVDLLKRLVD
jgi:DNA-binding MarR family transcriptional regulator